VRELHAMLCKRFAEESSGKWTTEELVGLSRLWKFEGNETLENAKQMLSDVSSDLDKLPLAIQARILKPDQLIDEINVAD